MEESLLSQFHLDYEYDRSWYEAKQDIKVRTERNKLRKRVKK